MEAAAAEEEPETCRPCNEDAGDKDSSPVACIVIGMAGSGKTTLMQVRSDTVNDTSAMIRGCCQALESFSFSSGYPPSPHCSCDRYQVTNRT